MPNYVEPFFGSGAVLLARPHDAGIETLNDLDCMVANFWRATKYNPDAVAMYADNPVNEADQHARHLWLCSQEAFRERMKVDPDFYDCQIAGWWVWGQCIWIGSGWCVQRGDRNQPEQLPHLGGAGMGINRKLPHLGNAGRGINRKLPHLGNAGRGINRKLPHLGNAGRGERIKEYFAELSARLRDVRVCCGEWDRVLSEAVTVNHGTTAVFLDPPYTEGDLQYSAGGCGGEIAEAVRVWCLANGGNRDLRIALCGYEGEHKMPDDWECVAWKAIKGYQARAKALSDRGRERIWFSPHCLKPPSLFGEAQ